jgi:hypothetical protein
LEGLEYFFAPDGTYLGHFGRSNEIYVTDASNVINYRKKKINIHKLINIHSVLLHTMPDYVKTNIYKSIYREMFGNISGGARIKSNSINAIASCNCNGYGLSAHGDEYNGDPIITLDNSRGILFDNIYNIKSTLFKEHIHMSDGGKSSFQRDLEAHLPLIKSGYFKKSTKQYKKLILQSAASFMWKIITAK